MESTSVMVGIGGQKGDGQLNLPNLGSNCVYPFKVSGFGAGIQVGVAKIAASGPVKNLTRLEDFPGDYGATEGQATVIGGGGGSSCVSPEQAARDHNKNEVVCPTNPHHPPPPVPEPGTYLLMGSGVLVLAYQFRSRRSPRNV